MSGGSKSTKWVGGNAPGNMLARNEFTIAGKIMNDLDVVHVAKFSKTYAKFSSVLEKVFIEKEGNCDVLFVRRPEGCARTWSNLEASVQLRAQSYFDIVKQSYRDHDELCECARVLWEKCNNKLSTGEDSWHIMQYMKTKKFVSDMIERDIIGYQTLQHYSGNKRKRKVENVKL
jgi:hypothetical protein